uniref:Uncharacterized protein n=1 Tax=Oryza rufipogon TaxID=4529 RepID=A0A0E0N0B7_ORYRU
MCLHMRARTVAGRCPGRPGGILGFTRSALSASTRHLSTPSYQCSTVKSIGSNGLKDMPFTSGGCYVHEAGTSDPLTSEPS